MNQPPRVTGAPCLPFFSWSCITPSPLLKMMTLPCCVPIASCATTLLHLQNVALVVMLGHSAIGVVRSAP